MQGQILIAVIAALFLVTAAAGAQVNTQGMTPITDGQDVRVRPSGLFDGITLTQAQADSSDAITQRYYALSFAINHSDADLRTRMRQILSLRERTRTEKRALLTPEQCLRFDKNAAAQKAQDERLINTLIEAAERQSSPS